MFTSEVGRCIVLVGDRCGSINRAQPMWYCELVKTTMLPALDSMFAGSRGDTLLLAILLPQLHRNSVDPATITTIHTHD